MGGERFDVLRQSDVAARVKRRVALWHSPVGSVPRLVRTERLVQSPVFLLSSVRSGSTLLRAILDSHSDIRAPHEMHLGSLRVTAASWYGEVAIEQLGLQTRDLENLLWDRILDLELAAAQKSIVVDKTPYNTIDWKRISVFWPQARFIFLTRHPVRVFQSLVASRPDVAVTEHYEKVVRYTGALAKAQAALPGTTIRYEELTTDPKSILRGLCSWLDVRYEPAMLNYGEQEHGVFRRGLGDWGANIHSGVIQPPQPDPRPDEVPDELRDSCRQLGYR